jgi:acyl carrier protein
MQSKNSVIIEIVKDQLDDSTKTINLDTRFDVINLDSLKFMLLLINLQDEKYNFSVDLNRIGSVETVKDLTDIVSYAS